jgi:integrase/recombinase XerD
MKFTDMLESLRSSFLESLRVKGQAPATLNTRSEALTTFFRWLTREGFDDVREVTREHIRAYQLSLTQSKMTAYTVQGKLSGLRRFFEYLETTDTVLLNPCWGMVLPKNADRLPHNILSQAEAVRILNAPDTQTKQGIRDKALLELFYSTGIRGEEMAQLTVLDVDCKNGFVRVTKGKFAKDRVVPMGSKAAQYVAEYLRQVRGPWSQHQKDERALWLSNRWPHGPVTKQAIAVLVCRYKKRAGITRPGRTHLWRHTCATHLVQGGANLAYVQRLLGHRSLETTQLYTRVSGAEVAQTIKRKHPRARVKT